MDGDAELPGVPDPDVAGRVRREALLVLPDLQASEDRLGLWPIRGGCNPSPGGGRPARQRRATIPAHGIREAFD
jgi:hypothetical protein